MNELAKEARTQNGCLQSSPEKEKEEDKEKRTINLVSKLEGRVCLTGQHEEEEEEECQELPSARNLDSGYAWLILLIMFLLQSSISGSSRVYGIIYARVVASGYYDREQASWPIASASSIENLAGILTPAMGQFFTWRQMELFSTSLFIIANLLAYYSKSLTLDIVALGLVQGLALSTCTVLSLAINNDYFERYRTTAYGIQMSGSTFGVLYLSPLVTWILATEAGHENFRLVYLALACVFCLNLILVLFIKPRIGNEGTSKEEEEEKKQTFDCEKAKVPHQQANQDLEQQQQRQQQQKEQIKSNGFAGSSSLASRKVSRFESHFERKSSIASVSYGARSRRQSALSRVATTGRPVAPPSGLAIKHQVNSKAPTPRVQLAKSKSGIELARADARSNCELINHNLLGKKISLCSMRHNWEFTNNNNNMSHHEHNHKHKHYNDNELNWQQRRSRAASFVCQPEVDASRFESQQSCHKTTSAARPSSGLIEFEDVGSLASYCTNQSASLLELLALKLDCQGPGDKRRGQGELCAQIDETHCVEGEEKFSLNLLRSLLISPYLHLSWIMLALYYLIARILVIILVDLARDHGHSLADSTNLLNYWSLGELLGRILLGSLIDLKFMSCKNCITLTCASVAALLALMAMLDSYLIYAICSLLIAGLISLEYMLINVLMVEYLGKHRVTSCYSLAACLSSAILFARPTMIGLFRDHLGTYDGLLLLLASLIALFALLFYLLEPLLVRKWPKCAL